MSLCNSFSFFTSILLHNIYSAAPKILQFCSSGSIKIAAKVVCVFVGTDEEFINLRPHAVNAYNVVLMAV